MSLLKTSSPAAKFKTAGDIVGGRVVRDSEEMQQRDFDSGALMFWDDGNARMQLVVTVDAGAIDPTIEDDDGYRTFYAKGDMLRAIRQACKRARLKGDVIPAGAELHVEMVGEEPLPRGKRGFPKKLYSATLSLPVEEIPEGATVGTARLAGQHDRNAAARARTAEPPF